MSDPTLLVLSSLAEGDKHGYAMMQDIEAFAGIRLGPGTLYGAITRLEEHGWIRPAGVKNLRTGLSEAGSNVVCYGTCGGTGDFLGGRAAVRLHSCHDTWRQPRERRSVGGSS